MHGCGGIAVNEILQQNWALLRKRPSRLYGSYGIIWKDSSCGITEPLELH